MIPGWAGALPFGDMVTDGTVAVAVSFVLFLVPSSNVETPSGRILDSEILPDIPWHIIILFGGGFALAKGFQASGLAGAIGEAFGFAGELPLIALILIICLGVTFLTELTSNTATTQTLLPILASVAAASDIDPIVLMVPATLSASCAFMLPVATPPNAIVFGSGRLRISEMARVGIVLNIIGAIIITGMFLLFGKFIF
jgi:sodium-dependent dicarboxylate transporter 2/3/5